MDIVFENRSAAGKRLADALSGYRNHPDLLVLALPRGGVPVAYEVARALNAELDILVVRKLGVPYRPELAMGAIASAGARMFNDDIIRASGVRQDQIESVMREQQTELDRREKAYRGNRPPPEVKDRTVILVDDGIATGATVQVGVKALRSLNPKSIVVAVPVAPVGTIEHLQTVADECICLSTPEIFYAVGQWYRDFGQTTDEEVHDLLSKARATSVPRPAAERRLHP